MELDFLLKTDVSSITRKSIKERKKALGKTKNAILKNVIKKKDKIELYFSSPQTYGADKYNIIVSIKDNDILVNCDCEGFNKQGFQYRATKKDAALISENRPDRRWSRYHGKNVLLCKHLWILFNKQKRLIDKYIKDGKK